MEIMAGDFPTQELLPKTVARITTGAALPEGADCIIGVRQLLCASTRFYEASLPFSSLF